MPEIKHHVVRITYQIKVDGTVTAGRAIDLADLAVTTTATPRPVQQTRDASTGEVRIIHSEVDTL